MVIDPTVVTLILTVGGIGVVGLTEMIKRLFKAQDLWVYVISLVVSAGATAFILATSSAFSWIALAGYTFVVFLEANGIYKAVAKPKTA